MAAGIGCPKPSEMPVCGRQNRRDGADFIEGNRLQQKSPIFVSKRRDGFVVQLPQCGSL
jgi:hypothetical protein